MDIAFWLEETNSQHKVIVRSRSEGLTESFIQILRFKALSNQLGVILGPFVGPLGTILGRFWGYLAQFEPILSHFGIILGPFLGYLEQF